MNIWIDGDACPNPIKKIIFRAAIKRKISSMIVANHSANIPASPYIKRILVSAGFDKADDYIAQHLKKGDLVVTADIILADQVIEKGAFALNPRGMMYSAQNIKQTLSMRNMNESLRSCGIMTGGPNALGPKEIQAFSNHLDKLITQSQSPRG